MPCLFVLPAYGAGEDESGAALLQALPIYGFDGEAGADAAGLIPMTGSSTVPALKAEEIRKAKELLGKEGAKKKRVKKKAKKKARDKAALVKKEDLPSEEDEEIFTPFELYLRGEAEEVVSTELDRFGYELFEGAPDTFAPVETVPVGPGYMLGPGDELRITLWGKVNVDHMVQIDREGKVSLRQLGVIHLAGLTFGEAKKVLAKALSRHFKATEVKINVSMGRLRSMGVFVVGKADSPGTYTLSSLSTLVNALFASGGPSEAGTMRDIQVKRGARTLVHFDVYDFLLKGDKGADIRLMPEDVIFIPTVGPLVAVAGKVRVPAIYELKGEERLLDVIEMAGGTSSTAYLQRVQVERVKNNSIKVVIDMDLTEVTGSANITLRDGDTIRVFPVSEVITNEVVLKGNLYRPGTYEWREGLRLGDLIKGPGDLLPETYLGFVLIERTVGDDHHKEYVSADLGRLFTGGGESEESENIELRPMDKVVVFNKWDLFDSEVVRVAGAVNAPGEVDYRPGMTVSDLVKLAGGLKKFAFMDFAEITRVTPTSEGPVSEKIIVNVEKAMAGEAIHDIELNQDDYLFIRAVPEWNLYSKVSIVGEVLFPGEYTILKGERLSLLIERAGGYTDDVYLKGAYFTRESVKVQQEERLKESIDRLEKQLLISSAETIEGALSKEEAEQEEVVSSKRQMLLAKMRSVDATGRIAIKLDTLEKLRSSSSDLVLEEGDVIVIPSRPQHVQVMGSVYNESAFIFDPKLKAKKYLKLAGGFTRTADEDEIYILKVDGTVISRRDGAMTKALDAGDTIVVPEEFEKVAWMREIKDFTQILYQIAVTAGVLIIVF